MEACREHSAAVLDLIIDRGAYLEAQAYRGAYVDPVYDTGKTPSPLALWNINVFNNPVKAGANTEHVVEEGDKLLHLAALKLLPEHVFTLLEGGVDVNARNAKYETPLSVALDQGYFERYFCRITENGSVGSSSDLNDLVFCKQKTIELLQSRGGVRKYHQPTSFRPAHRCLYSRQQRLQLGDLGTWHSVAE
ncbi:Ankyrin repeat and zinc finger domain-containing protein 1 [Elasticomyces elasticus]|nr:Ankyrin repeat and zinc finger domain-containing protein 1 [Elasticomyces elasticus]KAK3621067.1 Ankyrin repeat and zinc finger domain-containing protein 1 [Elasticomyces elasticus]KAK4904531.1 Ankyrin repeat and zinc finger domain-containing protein 1 [Elasticomyces elasticus]KAK5740845.1 Ankyrin repeat and zinc finger domain-containing protein 1 [Elasticomyces elasticus]